MKPARRRLDLTRLEGPGGPLPRWLAACLVCLAFALPARATPPAKVADRLHAEAVGLFRQARFPEAFGRFVALADAGHAPSAGIALWMWQQGPDLFGKDWDCSSEQLEAWSRLAGTPTPPMRARLYGRVAPGGDRARAGGLPDATLARPSGH